jgi:hypothetical protein
MKVLRTTTLVLTTAAISSAAALGVAGTAQAATLPHGTVGLAAKTKKAVTILRSLKRAGLPIDGYVNYTAATDDNHLLGRPGQYVSKVNFHDTRLDKESDFDIAGGGSIETFRSVSDAKRRYSYVHSITSLSPLFGEYHYRHGATILRLSFDLTPSQAAAYKRAFEGSRPPIH